MSCYNIYLDNPGKVTKWFSALNEDEKLIFYQGQLSAFADMLDQIRDSKIKILEKLHDLKDAEEKPKHQMQLLARLRILDKYDQHYEQRLNHLAKRMEHPELQTFAEEEYA